MKIFLTAYHIAGQLDYYFTDCQQHPENFLEMLNIITEYAQNVPFLLQYVQIDTVQQKRQPGRGQTIQTELRA